MAFAAVKQLGRVARYLPNTKTIFSPCSISKTSVFIGDSISNSRAFTRSLFFLCKNRDSVISTDPTKSTAVAAPWSNQCNCCYLHTKGDKELAAFLEEEISNESNAHKSNVVPELDEFSCKYDGADILLAKTFNNEQITIRANVNHSVDAEENMETNQAKDNESGEMKAKPDFSIEILKGGKTLTFECSFTDMNAEEGGENYNDTFQINEISMHQAEPLDSTYSVAGDIMDGYLYDLLMNYLDERGISNNFVDKMVSIFTSYEHKLYIDLLNNMKRFVEK